VRGSGDPSWLGYIQGEHRTTAMTERIDCVVIGAGVVGLAVARELALAGAR